MWIYHFHRRKLVSWECKSFCCAGRTTRKPFYISCIPSECWHHIFFASLNPIQNGRWWCCRLIFFVSSQSNTSMKIGTLGCTDEERKKTRDKKWNMKQYNDDMTCILLWVHCLTSHHLFRSAVLMIMIISISIVALFIRNACTNALHQKYTREPFP